MATCVATGMLEATSASAATESPSPSPTPATTPLLDVDGSTALVFIGLVAGGVALLWFSLLLFDVWSTNRWRQRNQTQLINQMIKGSNRDGLSAEEVRQLVSAMDRPPRGASGLTQSLIALTIVTLVGVALIATLVSTANDSSDLRKTIITSLLSILAAISGFYFGARTAQTSTEQATKPPETSPGAGPAQSTVPIGEGDGDGEEATGSEMAPAEPEFQDNPDGDEGDQNQDDQAEVLPTPPEGDHR
jgi:hypothetical protein